MAVRLVCSKLKPFKSAMAPFLKFDNSLSDLEVTPLRVADVEARRLHLRAYQGYPPWSSDG